MPGESSSPPPKPLHIFWDANNILGGAERAADEQGLVGFPRIRISFVNLVDLIRNGRHPVQARLAGSIPPPTDEVWKHVEALGFSLDLTERTAEGREGRVDETLRERMLTTDFDYDEKGTIALLTGDGRGVDQNEGFFANLRRLRSRGWDVELFSWECQVNGRMRDWVRREGKYVRLDPWFSALTFVKREGADPGRPAGRLPPPPYF